MGIVLKANWGQKKAKTRGDLKNQIINGSEMLVSVSLGEECPQLIYIEIHGILAQIPSLKNNRQFGGIERRTLAALEAMDKLFIDAVTEQGFKHSQLFFGEKMVHITILAGGRKTANEDNAMTTIKDWLELRTKVIGRKNKRQRGWGISLIKDDIQARGYALKAQDIGLNQAYTSISIKPWSDIQEEAFSFMTRCRQVGATCQ